MPEFQSLRGRNALSDFRLRKLLSSLQSAAPAITGLSADYWHFIELEQSLSRKQQRILERVLTYGPSSDAANDGSVSPGGQLLLVVPRLGTISPWSSKATDIAHSCGLASVRRIERGIAWHVHRRTAGALGPADRTTLLSLIHDRMTETVLDSVDAARELFHHYQPGPLKRVDVRSGASDALQQANRDLGLALSEDEIEYLAGYFQRIGRDPTDAELMMFAQANSEHCRHKIFNADWVIDGEVQDKSLFDMIRETHRCSPDGTVVAYSDNSAIMEGATVSRLYPGFRGEYRSQMLSTHTLMKVETHNHPTAISPFPGAATGSGGEIRDEGATGRGAKPKAGLNGFSVSHLRIPGNGQPWEAIETGKPDRIVSALAIMLEGPIGAASFNNEFGRPNLFGYFRTYEQMVDGVVRGYHKPIMVAGGIGNISADQSFKKNFGAGTLIVQLGGPGMLIGMGGGAASSMATGANTADLDFDSVQRGNPEIQRRAQEVIDRCWELGDANPILSIHDVGAGGLSNALPELVHGAGCGARVNLREIPSEESGMTPMQVWSNEAQERYMLAVEPRHFDAFNALCERERCPFSLVGTATDDGRLTVSDPLFGNNPVDVDLSVILGKPPRMTRDVSRLNRSLPGLDFTGMEIEEAARRVMRFPAVADKTFLISIGDRTVGGLCSRDPLVGPWQVPVADVAVTLMGFDTRRGEAFTMGERTPLAVINGPASGRMAIGEAITNIAAARIAKVGDVKMSANWMAPAGYPGEDATLYDTVRAVGMELCPALGISIPVGKDSMSMRTAWEEGGREKEVVSPLSLIVSAFAPVVDARRTLTPQLVADEGTTLLFIDLSGGKQRLGGSVLAQVFNQVGNETPDVESPEKLRAFFEVIQNLNESGKLLAYHDRSDGGLFVTLAEMMFASHVGVTVDVGIVDIGAASRTEDALAVLFNEELGAVVQVNNRDRDAAMEAFDSGGLGENVHALGSPNRSGRLIVKAGRRTVYDQLGTAMHRIWSETSFHMQRLRDNPLCAQSEYDRILDAADPGLHCMLTFDINEDVSAPFVATGARPRIAILREQGVNGHVEMAAAFDRAGFCAVDVHMTDIISGRVSLTEFTGAAACGGFSYGDVLGAGEGWAKSILFNPRARDEFEGFFGRSDTFALGVCNGCQMMSNLQEIIPGTDHWPHFVRNRSEQFEARFVMVEVVASPSILLSGMESSRFPVATAHGEGYAEFASKKQFSAATPYVSLRYVDNCGQATECYPFNPNGSPDGVTGLTSRDGRFTILMPHPERVFRSVQNSWYPDAWGEDGPWMRMFRNARVRVG
jgi:phosphoribosylformylglycinamidine synthase